MFEANAFLIIFLVAVIITIVWSRHRARQRRADQNLLINWNQNVGGDYIRMGDDADPVVYVNPSRIAPEAVAPYRGEIQSVEGEGAVKRLSTIERRNFGPVFSTTEESGLDQNVVL